MMFDNALLDNTMPSPPSRWEAIRKHLPLILVLGGAAALFVGLHAAATTVAIAAGLHLAVGLLAILGTGLHRRRNQSADGDPS